MDKKNTIIELENAIDLDELIAELDNGVDIDFYTLC